MMHDQERQASVRTVQTDPLENLKTSLQTIVSKYKTIDAFESLKAVNDAFRGFIAKKPDASEQKKTEAIRQTYLRQLVDKAFVMLREGFVPNNTVPNNTVFNAEKFNTACQEIAKGLYSTPDKSIYNNAKANTLVWLYWQYNDLLKDYKELISRIKQQEASKLHSPCTKKGFEEQKELYAKNVKVTQTSMNVILEAIATLQKTIQKQGMLPLAFELFFQVKKKQLVCSHKVMQQRDIHKNLVAIFDGNQPSCLRAKCALSLVFGQIIVWLTDRKNQKVVDPIRTYKTTLQRYCDDAPSDFRKAFQPLLDAKEVSCRILMELKDDDGEHLLQKLDADSKHFCLHADKTGSMVNNHCVDMASWLAAATHATDQKAVTVDRNKEIRNNAIQRYMAAGHGFEIEDVQTIVCTPANDEAFQYVCEKQLSCDENISSPDSQFRASFESFFECWLGSLSQIYMPSECKVEKTKSYVERKMDEATRAFTFMMPFALKFNQREGSSGDAKRSQSSSTSRDQKLHQHRIQDYADYYQAMLNWWQKTSGVKPQFLTKTLGAHFLKMATPRALVTVITQDFGSRVDEASIWNWVQKKALVENYHQLLSTVTENQDAKSAYKLTNSQEDKACYKTLLDWIETCPEQERGAYLKLLREYFQHLFYLSALVSLIVDDFNKRVAVEGMTWDQKKTLFAHYKYLFSDPHRDASLSRNDLELFTAIRSSALAEVEDQDGNFIQDEGAHLAWLVPYLNAYLKDASPQNVSVQELALMQRIANHLRHIKQTKQAFKNVDSTAWRAFNDKSKPQLITNFVSMVQKTSRKKRRDFVNTRINSDDATRILKAFWPVHGDRYLNKTDEKAALGARKQRLKEKLAWFMSCADKDKNTLITSLLKDNDIRQLALLYAVAADRQRDSIDELINAELNKPKPTISPKLIELFINDGYDNSKFNGKRQYPRMLRSQGGARDQRGFWYWLFFILGGDLLVASAGIAILAIFVDLGIGTLALVGGLFALGVQCLWLSQLCRGSRLSTQTQKRLAKIDCVLIGCMMGIALALVPAIACYGLLTPWVLGLMAIASTFVVLGTVTLIVMGCKKYLTNEHTPPFYLGMKMTAYATCSGFVLWLALLEAHIMTPAQSAIPLILFCLFAVLTTATTIILYLLKDRFCMRPTDGGEAKSQVVSGRSKARPASRNTRKLSQEGRVPRQFPAKQIAF